MNKTVLIFGTFNPITNAHIKMGILAREKFPHCRVIYIPSKDRFLSGWKGMDEGSILTAEKRIFLMEEAFKPYGFEVDDIEANSDISGKTYDTLKALHEKYQDSEFYICMGTDKLKEIHMWYHGTDLIKENKWLIIKRDHVPFEEAASPEILAYRENFTEAENAAFETVSADLIRKAYRSGNLESVKEYVPENVYRFLKDNREVYR